MSRKIRRKLQRALTKKGYSKKQSKSMVDIVSAYSKGEAIPEGVKVRVNPDKTNKGNRIRNEWVDSNQDKIFTVKYRKDNHSSKPTLVEFEEDNTWLWHVRELIVLK